MTTRTEVININIYFLYNFVEVNVVPLLLYVVTLFPVNGRDKYDQEEKTCNILLTETS